MCLRPISRDAVVRHRDRHENQADQRPGDLRGGAEQIMETVWEHVSNGWSGNHRRLLVQPHRRWPSRRDVPGGRRRCAGVLPAPPPRKAVAGRCRPGVEFSVLPDEQSHAASAPSVWVCAWVRIGAVEGGHADEASPSDGIHNRTCRCADLPWVESRPSPRAGRTISGAEDAPYLCSAASMHQLTRRPFGARICAKAIARPDWP